MAVWNQWATSTATTGDCWIYWTSASDCTSTAVSTSDTWSNWTSTAATTTSYYPPQRQLTAAQIRQQQESEERWRKQAEQERKKREAAERRAQELLEANLALLERERLRKDGHIVVHGRSGCRYRIRRGRTGNVDVINKDGFITHRLCAHPGENVPDHDTMLAQKLMLEHDEEGFNRIANRHEQYGSQGRVLEPMH